MLGFPKCQFSSQESNNYLLLGTGTSSTTCHELGQRQLPRVKTIVFQLGKCKFAIMSACVGAAHFGKCQFSSSRSKVCMPPLRCCNRSCVQAGGWGRLGEHSSPLSRIESFKYFHTPKNSIQCGGANNQSDSGCGSI